MASNVAPQQKGLIGWIEHRTGVVSFLDHSLNHYPTPKNLSYWWNFGSLAGINLVIMILTGLFLAMHYTADVNTAFDSVERIMRDVNFGWLMRYVHANGASMFFIVVFIHMFRGFYYGSYKPPREVLWMLGVVILLLMMATAFMGYVLPWGQMSFWGATVITNLFSALPFVGETLVTWLWGGFAVDNPTLTRFYALHFVMPFVIAGVAAMHIVVLHRFGSNNPLGIDVQSKKDTIPFHPYYTIKDMFGLGVYLLVFGFFVFYAPNYLGHADNYIPADAMTTPAHIVPEWYFLPFYAILRAITFDIGIPFTEIVLIDAKLGGVLAMFGAVVILFFLPWLDRHPIRSGRFRPLFKIAFWFFVWVTITLGFAGALQPDEPFVYKLLGFKLYPFGSLDSIIVTQFCTFWYFFHFLVVLPLLSIFEKGLPLPASISQPVLTGGSMKAQTAVDSKE